MTTVEKVKAKEQELITLSVQINSMKAQLEELQRGFYRTEGALIQLQSQEAEEKSRKQEGKKKAKGGEKN